MNDPLLPSFAVIHIYNKGVQSLCDSYNFSGYIGCIITAHAEETAMYQVPVKNFHTTTRFSGSDFL